MARGERVFVALGSNLGDRAQWLAEARERLAALPETRMVRASSVEETAPLGDVPQGPYLNQMVELDTGLEPEASFQGGSRGFGQWEQDVTPQLRSFVGTLHLTF